MRPYLTASFFETGAMATPTKLQNPTVLGLGVPAGTYVAIMICCQTAKRKVFEIAWYWWHLVYAGFR